MDSSHGCDLVRVHDALWTLPVEVGGKKRRFVLDFGAGVTALDASLAREFGAREVGRVAGRRVTGERLEVPLVEPVDLGVAGTRLRPRALAAFDLARLLPPDWEPIDGVLALDVLELGGTPFEVDFARDRFGFGARTGGLADVPARLFRQIPDVSLVVMLAVRAADGDLWFELDNSNTGPVLVAPAAAERLGIAVGAKEAEIEVRGAGTFRTPVRGRDVIYDGNLGRTFVDGRTFAFDLCAGRVRIGPAAVVGAK